MLSTLTVFTSNCSINPEKELWVAVLKQATDDAEAMATQIQNNPGIWSDPEFREEALGIRLFFQHCSMDPGGFGFICDLLELDPVQATKRIHELYLQYLIPAKERCLMANYAMAR
ncbi:MAG: hypothetical protein HQL80_05850 [Magnetococcales bacterium]|nr:hypothetical protein [Magnetococcales bacterium]MBF0583744.1 hypothetical protein [Magnetococcales bacterium]